MLKRTEVNFDPFRDGELEAAVPATEAQKEMWSSIASDPEANLCYNESIAMSLKGDLNRKLLADSINRLIKNHDSLRATFSPRGKEFLVALYREVELPFVDLSGLKTEARNAQVGQIVERLGSTAFDLERGPLFFFELVKLADKEHVLFLSAHHLVCDGWSIAFLASEMSKIYQALEDGREVQTFRSKQFYEYAQEEYDCPATNQYWENEFRRLPKPMELPLEKERPAVRTFSSERVDYPLSREIFSVVKNMAGQNGVSLYQYLLTSFKTCLYHLCKQEDLVVGISVAGQATEGLEATVGHLVHFLPIRTRVRDGMSFKELLTQTRDKVLDANERKNTTFGKILRSLDVPRDPSRIPLISAVFNVDQLKPGQGLKFKHLKASYVCNPRKAENFEIRLNAVVSADQCVLDCQYNTNLFTKSGIEKLLRGFENCLEHFSKNPEARIGAFRPSVSKSISAAPSEAQEVERPTIKDSSRGNPELARKIWEEVMNIGGIPGDANFFSIGGHSLLGVDICHRVMEETGLKLSLKDLVQRPTINSFGALLPEERKKTGKSPTEQDSAAEFSCKGLADGVDEAELTLSQFQAWYQEQIHANTNMHNLPSSIRVKSRLDMEKLKRAYRKIIGNHPALRTSIQTGPVQKVEEAQDVFEKLDLRLIEGKTLEEAKEEMQTDALMAFKLNEAPLFRSRVYKIGDDDFIIYNNFHHIIFDGWSYGIFFQELNEAYEGKDLESEGSSFLDYAVWQQKYLQGKEFKKDLAYWKSKLEGPLPVLEMPTDRPRPAVVDPSSREFPFRIEAELFAKLRSFTEKTGYSLFNVFLACFKKTLMDYSQSKELLVGIPVRGRNTSDQMNTIGYYVNTVAIKTSSRDGVQDFLEVVREEVAEALARQNAPFEKVRESLNLKRDASRAPLVQTFFSFQETGDRKELFDGNPYTHLDLHKDSIHTDLDIWIHAGKNEVKGSIEYRKDLFDEETISRLNDYFKDLIAFVAGEQGQMWKEFRSPSVGSFLAKVNDTFVERKDPRIVVDFVDEAAKNSPFQTALVAGDGKLSYAELSKLSSQFAGHLKRKGVRKGDLVGISLDREVNLLVVALGIMKAGAGYVPLDPYFPPERLDYMVEQSGIQVIVVNSHYGELFKKHPVEIVEIESVSFSSETPCKERVELDQTAYVIYTSGSTGMPKGVNISYRTAMNFFHAMRKEPGFGADDKILAVTTFCFDISVLELFLPIVAGGTVFIASKEQTIDGEALKNTIETQDINVLQATPPTWRILLAAGWKGGKNFKALCGGEAFPRDLLEALIPSCESVWNMYGPTEATVWATCKKMESHKGPILIGKPIENYSVYVLDENQRPVPFGAVGELYIGGEGLALGYYKRDDLTEERFVKDVVRGAGKMYKTGDLARFHQNGELECLGRNDDQVKIRGYRIELGEVEAALADQEEVAQAVAMAREDRPGDVRLVAYLISKGGLEIDQFKLREKLARRLPPYMIPVNYIQMDSFPLTLTGKVERKKLPAVDFEKCMIEESSGRRSGAGDESIGEIELRLSKIWMQSIGVENYDLEDNFFDVGGNSLVSVEFFAKLNDEFGIDLPLATLVANSRFKELVEIIEEKTVASGEPVKKEAEQIGDSANGSGSSPYSYNVPPICESIVPIRIGGSKTPVFCFHGVGGNILNYMKIAPYMGDRSVFGVQARGVDGKSEPLKSLEDMSRIYMEEIRLVQPQGPYLLAGASMGGLLALETAIKLNQAGEKVASVIMLDSFGPGCSFDGYDSKGGYLSDRWFSFKWNLKRRLVGLQTKVLSGLGMPIPHRIRHFNVEVNNYLALWGHNYNSYDGSIDLVRAPVVENGWYKKPDMGWRRVVRDEVRIYTVEGEHDNFVEAPKLPGVLKSVFENY